MKLNLTFEIGHRDIMEWLVFTVPVISLIFILMLIGYVIYL